MKNKISFLSRALLVVASVLLVYSVFQPIWQIQLDAPQYPEGLRLRIYADRIGGDVDIVNGLNHYIGMKTLHTEDFIEFRLLPYLIGAFALLAMMAALIGRRAVLNGVFTLFVLFGVVAMADFWRWEYNYGHDLDPNAAIIVPGQAYQPPLIGFKQLLNFGAYSIPDKGGWLFVASGLLMLVAVVKETLTVRALRRAAAVATASVLPLLMFGACQASGPEPIRLNRDNCDFCKMSISDERFACELVTVKGRVYKFDDASCMLHYSREHADKTAAAGFYVCDFLGSHALTDVKAASLVKSEAIESPMGGHLAAFSSKDSAAVYQQKLGGALVSWNELATQQ
jgi:copper chaperone NosL